MNPNEGNQGDEVERLLNYTWMFPEGSEDTYRIHAEIETKGGKPVIMQDTLKEGNHFEVLNLLASRHDCWRSELADAEAQLCNLEGERQKGKDAVPLLEAQIQAKREEIGKVMEGFRRLRRIRRLLERSESTSKKTRKLLDQENNERVKLSKSVGTARQERDSMLEQLAEQQGLTEEVWAKLYAEEIDATKNRVEKATKGLQFFLQQIERQIESTRAMGFDVLIAAFVERISSLEIPAVETAAEEEKITAIEKIRQSMRRLIELWDNVTKGILDAGGNAKDIARAFEKKIQPVHLAIGNELL